MGKSYSQHHGNKKKPSNNKSSSDKKAAPHDTKTPPNSEDSVNRPRNMMVTDATTPLHMSWTGRYRIHQSITVQQTADPETWPGGAVWDLGWCLAQLMIGIAADAAAGGSSSTIHSTTTHGNKSTTRTMQLPLRVTQSLREHFPRLFTSSHQETLLILELGCGVGLTGLVSAAAFAHQAKAVVLTDLPVVIEKVTQPNVLLNTTVEKHKTLPGGSNHSHNKVGGAATTHPRLVINKGKCQVVATPLCWGNAEDEQAVAALLQSLDTSTSQKQHRQISQRGPQKSKQSTAGETLETSRSAAAPTPHPVGTPHVILIGDVAYQHTPGAPSHFDALVSTLQRFLVSDQTLVIFGTRIRMPASVDLTDLLLQSLVSVVEPPLSANELESSAFAAASNTMSIYFLRKQCKTTASATAMEDETSAFATN